MKTLLLAPELFASQGGISRILRLYLKALCDLSEPDGEVGLVVLNDVQLDSRELRAYGNDHLVVWNACGKDRIRFVRGALAEAPRFETIICGHIGQLPVAWLCRRRNRNLKYILVAHGLEVWRRFNLVEKLALRRADQVWCVSEYTRRQVIQNSGIREEKTFVLPNALDPLFLQETEATGNRPEPIILTISRLCHADRYKGVDHLIEALPQIRGRVPGAQLKIIGRGDDLPRLQELAARHGVADAVRFLGFVGDREMKDELSHCRIFALPSEKEGFGLVYLEAMAFGKACVGARAGGVPEVITPDAGLLCDYGDVAGLARTCAAALEREWDPAAIRRRAGAFSYPVFRDQVKALLAK
jgi:phosphatidyl-myo-inositol dimannoside synthase